MSTSIMYHVWGAIGYVLCSTKFTEGETHFHLAKRRANQRCSRCKSSDVCRAGQEERRVRAVPVGRRPVILVLHLHRLSCRECGAVAIEDAGVAAPRKGYTKRLAEFVLTLCRFCPISHVAFLAGLAWGTVKEILKADLSHRAARIDWRGITHIAIDEISFGAGQKNYLTVVMDLNEDRVLYVREGRDKQALAPFFKTLRRRRTKLQAVAMDMHEPYRLAVQEYYNRPCTIVYDRFHVMKLLSEHLDEIRRDEVRKAEASDAQKYLKGQRYVILRANENLTDDARAKLAQLLAINEPLSKAYILKEQLRSIWSYVDRQQGEQALRGWVAQARDSGIERLRRFAATITRHWEGIVAVFDQPISTGPLEGLNNAIKVLKRKAYGYRDREFFKLRVLFIHECKPVVTGA